MPATQAIEVSSLGHRFGPESAWASRLQLRSTSVERYPTAALDVRVEVEVGGRTGIGEGHGVGLESVELRLAADATLGAIRDALQEDVALRIVGIKLLRVFDADVVAVALDAPEAPGRYLVGARPVRGSVAEEGVLAVLDALGSAPSRLPGAPALSLLSQATPATGPGADLPPREDRPA